MGNLCTGDKDAGEAFEEGEIDEDEMDDWGAERAETPSQTVAYNINKLPKSEKEEGKLSKLQEKINNMNTNQRKGKRTLVIARVHGQGKPLDDPYLIRFNKAIYIGEWKFSTDINSTVPGGIGRLYRDDEIMEGEIMTFLSDDQKNRMDFKDDLADQMIRETKRRAKFFNKDKQSQKVSSETDLIRNLKIVIDGQGRIFSRTMEQSGTFAKGKLDGKGEVTIKYQTDTYNYKGEFRDGRKNGKGVETYKNTIYDGEFNDDLKEGRGSLTLFISHKFQKQVEEENDRLSKDNADRNPSDIVHCIEEFIKLKNEQFQKPLEEAIAELAWKGPLKDIKGLSFLNDPNFLYDHIRRSKFLEQYRGEFIDNEFQGYGRYTWFNGKCYDGNWIKGKMNGVGQFFWQKGVQYFKGEYKDDMKHGKGIIQWSLTRRFRGDWAYGLRHGYGELIEINQIEEQEIPPQQLVNNSMLGNLFKKETKKKKTAKVVVTGGVFDKDKLKETYFTKQFIIETDIDKIKREENKMVCFVKGIRYEEEDFDDKK